MIVVVCDSISMPD